MTRNFAFLAALLVASATTLPVVQAKAQQATDDGIAAITLPEPQLRNFLTRAIFTTTTIKMAMAAVGIKANCALLRPAFEKAIADTLPAWRANLIAAHRQHVPADILARAAAAGPVAGAALIVPYRDAVGATMQASSEPLLKTAAATALQPSFDAAKKVDMKSVDLAARQAEAKQAQADGTILCGLQ